MLKFQIYFHYLSSRKNYSDGNLQHASHVSHVSYTSRNGVKYVSKYKSSETQVDGFQ